MRLAHDKVSSLCCWSIGMNVDVSIASFVADCPLGCLPIYLPLQLQQESFEYSVTKKSARCTETW